ncbi:MAG TPA: hypothetical protein VF543_22575 [Pyrinomonadaceae bacterium]|jgi:hypothetical protein
MRIAARTPTALKGCFLFIQPPPHIFTVITTAQAVLVEESADFVSKQVDSADYEKDGEDEKGQGYDSTVAHSHLSD